MYEASGAKPVSCFKHRQCRQHVFCHLAGKRSRLSERTEEQQCLRSEYRCELESFPFVTEIL